MINNEIPIKTVDQNHPNHLCIFYQRMLPYSWTCCNSVVDIGIVLLEFKLLLLYILGFLCDEHVSIACKNIHALNGMDRYLRC